MRQKSVKGLVALGIVKGFITLGILLFFSVFSECGASAEIGAPSEIINEEHTFEELNSDEVN